MGIEQTMDLRKKQRIQGRKEIGVLSKLWILELVKKQRIQGRKQIGVDKLQIWVYNEVKRIEAEKSWGLDKLWA